MIVRRASDDLGNGMRRLYFPERVAARRDRRAPLAGINKREPCPRLALAAIVDPSRYSYAELSRLLGKSDGFLRRFVLHGVPRALMADDHRKLADFLGVDERALGIRCLWRPAA